MRPWLATLLVLVSCSVSGGEGHWKLLSAPAERTVVFANGTWATRIVYAGSTLSYQSTDGGRETDRKTLSLTSPLPERIAAGAELRLAIAASSLSANEGFVSLSGCMSAVLYAGRTALQAEKRVQVLPGNPLPTDPGYLLVVRLSMNDANISAGKGDGPIPEWVYAWTTEPMPATAQPAATAAPSRPHWKLVSSPGAGTVRYPNGPFATVIAYDGGSMTVDTTFQGVAPERRTFTVTTPLPEIIAGGEMTLGLAASALSGNEAFLHLVGGEVVSAGRSELRAEKRVPVRGGNPDPNDQAGHFLVVRMLVNDANVSAGNPQGRPPQWVWEWVAP